jgi:hypothetical protein
MLSAKAVQGGEGEKMGILYEVSIGDRILVCLPKTEAVAFLDGIIAGINVVRGVDDNSDSPTD